MDREKLFSDMAKLAEHISSKYDNKNYNSKAKLVGLTESTEIAITLTKNVTWEIITDIRDYLVAILDEWHKRSDEPHFLENNIMVYNHLRKELDDLTEYAEKLGVEL